jgi:hypothetical protein
MLGLSVIMTTSSHNMSGKAEDDSGAVHSEDGMQDVRPIRTDWRKLTDLLVRCVWVSGPATLEAIRSRMESEWTTSVFVGSQIKSMQDASGGWEGSLHVSRSRIAFEREPRAATFMQSEQGQVL